MGKIWQKKGGSSLHPLVEAYTVGNDYIIDIDLVPYDVQGSMAHGEMLEKIGLLTKIEKNKIFAQYREILRLHKAGKFKIKIEDEDCHTAIENYLLKRLGDIGKKIHIGRSRNDQVLTAQRLYTKDHLQDVRMALKGFITTTLAFAKKMNGCLCPAIRTRNALCRHRLGIGQRHLLKLRLMIFVLLIQRLVSMTKAHWEPRRGLARDSICAVITHRSLWALSDCS